MDLRISPSTLDTINTLFLLIFVALVFLAFVRIGLRYISFKRAGVPVPVLLKRDLFFFGGLSVPFIGVLFFRWADVNARAEAWYPYWVIISGLLALSAVGYWVWIEYFTIDK